MSASITFPKYSFVQAQSDSEGCCTDPGLCLPLSSPANLTFQATGPDFVTQDLVGHSISFFCIVVAPDATPRISVQTTGPFDYLWPFIKTDQRLIGSGVTGFFNDPNGNHTFEQYNMTHLTYTPASPSPILVQNHPVAVGDCFKLQFVLDVLNGSGAVVKRYWYGCSTCFVRTDASDTCFTSVLRFGNRALNDAFDYDYTTYYWRSDNQGYDTGKPPLMQSIELPMYLRDPIMTNDQKVYTKSDGSITKIYERKEEQYQLETDLMPYRWHKALDVALSHDYVEIHNANATGFDPINTATTFVKKDNYEIEYQKAPLSSLGKGACKLLNATPVHLINNNCA